MRLGLGLGLPALSRSAYSPARLFAAGKVGAWYSAYDSSYMTVNSDGSGGAPSVGGTIGRLVDRSGGGFHMLQATAGSRPLNISGYAAFSHLNAGGTGVRRWMQTADASYGGTTQAATGLLIVDVATIPSDSFPFTYTLAMTSPYVFPTRQCSIAWRCSPSAFEIWVNGTQFTAAALASTALIQLFLGASAANSVGLSRFYEMVTIAETLSDIDFLALRNYGLRQARAVGLDGTILVARGDSRTYGSSSTNVSPWINLTSAFPNGKKFNEGKGGDGVTSPAVTTAELLAKYPLGALNCMVMFLGRNDIDVSAKTAAETYAALSTYCQTMVDAGWRVVVCTEVQITNASIGLDYNTLINAGAIGHFAHAIANLYGRTELQNRLDTTYFADGTHFTDAGNAVVNEVITAAIAAAIAGPNPNFSGTPLSGVDPLTVVFTDTSTGSPTSWLWDFGDGNTSTLQNPTHQYNGVGNYTVSLTATNASGSHICTKTNYVSDTASLAPPVANKALWFKKNGASGSTWTDASGNGRDLTLFNSPTIAGGTVTFNGTTQYGKTSAFTLNQPCTIYMRVKPITWTNNDYLCDGNTDNTMVLAQSGTTPTVKAYSTGGFIADNTNLTLGSFHSVGFGRKTNGTDFFIQVSGSAETNGALTGGAVGGFTLGRFGTSSSRFGNFEVAEIIVYADDHDATERAAALAYLDSL